MTGLATVCYADFLLHRSRDPAFNVTYVLLFDQYYYRTIAVTRIVYSITRQRFIVISRRCDNHTHASRLI